MRHKQQIRGHLDLLTLSVLADGPLHGYAVIERLRARSGEVFDLPEGSMYPALHRLERSDLITAEWSSVQGRRRKTYRLTDRGRRALSAQRRDWEEFATAVRSVVGGAPWPATN
ncbi:MAG: PadR family transcriptional regulator [Microthrixaceae bacterium]|nr:PadR family transcriptional regulator [Microthrixaceae bacterium]